jgi:transaldolase / glucose-6-phosphate isomerase
MKIMHISVNKQMNKLIELLNYGQSYWLDNLTREKITSGELNKRVTDQGLRGITSNPSIFDKAIANSNDYDEQIAELVKNGKTPEQIYEALTIKDVQDACDILKPVYNQSDGKDGFVSLEVSPYLAHDTQGSMAEARKLHKAVGRANCMIKIPGTPEGIPAIEQMLYEGININITLLFSVERYEEIARAYLRAIERRLADGSPINNIVSVASIFISRIDVLTDQLLGQRISLSEGPNSGKILELLLGKAGIVTARLSYQRFKEIFKGKNWKKLETKGANMQRLLWASTSTKNPLYDDLRYVEELIGSNTVNTITDETIAAFTDHGKLRKNAIEENTEQAKQFFSELKKQGIDMALVTQQLENEGIQKFTEAYNKLISSLAQKRLKVLGNDASPQQISCGKLDKELNAAYAAMDEKQAGRLLFAKDPHLWKSDPGQIKAISQCLGWLTLPDHFTKNAEVLIDFALEVKEEGYTHAVLLGMGGSSLCSVVTGKTFATAKGYLELRVLDNTDPEAILEVENNIDIEKTLFIVASKSGTTQETLSFFRYFYQQLQKKNKDRPGKNFVAITDAGTPLVKLAGQYNFRKVFLNQPDLGGRYSVLSDFGVLPMALMGLDIKGVLSNARQMQNSCNAVPAADNPGVSLGVAMGICQRHGRDKVTFVLSSSINSFGYWVEQLLAESTGKEGKGLIPVNGEQTGPPDAYGNDRIFIHIYLASDNNKTDEKKLKALEESGHPVVRIKLADKMALGGEYYRWEVAAAVAGMVIGINAFDQPNVEESKKNTREILNNWQKDGSFKKADPILTHENLSVFSGQITRKMQIYPNETAGDFINDFFAMAEPDDYIAILPYFLMTDYRTNILQTLRHRIRDERKVATTLLNGPRYLHSTGQLHKGGPATGLYIILIGDKMQNLPIPGEDFGFAILHEAQALGDFRSLDDKARRVILIRLGQDVNEGLNKLSFSVRNAKSQLVYQETI